MHAQVVGLDAIVVPVSGGGMISGVAMVAKALKPGILIIAAEPLGTNSMADVAACVAAQELVQLPSKPFTIADGLQGADIITPQEHFDLLLNGHLSEYTVSACAVNVVDVRLCNPGSQKLLQKRLSEQTIADNFQREHVAFAMYPHVYITEGGRHPT